MEQAKNQEATKPITNANWLGEVLPSNFKKYKLGDVAEIVISSIDKKTKEGEHKVKLCNFVDVYHNWAITESMYNSFMIASANDKNIERFSLRKGYVAFTKDSETRNDIGISTYIADNFDDVVLGYHCALVKPNEDILLGKYLNAFMHSDYIKKYLELNATGSGMRYTLSVQTLYDMPILLPSVEEQEYIGNIISTIDRKIAVNRAVNHNLEAIAKQLYDYWFVQFDFPNEEGKPYKSSGGEMVWNEKLHREIPHDWDVVNLSEYLNVYTEKVTANNLGASCKYAPIEVLPRRRMSFNECSPIENAVSGLCRFRKKQILLSNRRVYFHKVCIAAFDGVTRDTVIILNKKNKALLGYAYQIVNDDAFIEYATRHSYGSEQPVLSWESAKIYKTFKPRNQLDIIYSKRICPIIDSVIKNELEIAKLIKQRDELLPLLMNGQASVNYDLPNSHIYFALEYSTVSFIACTCNLTQIGH